MLTRHCVQGMDATVRTDNIQYCNWSQTTLLSRYGLAHVARIRLNGALSPVLALLLALWFSLCLGLQCMNFRAHGA